MIALSHYWKLTKPNIVLLVVITALAALAAQGLLFSEPLDAFLMVIAIGMAAGSANAFNQFLDRDIDAVMDRTKSKRPLAMKLISPAAAFSFALILGFASTWYLWFFWNPLAAVISVATIFYYTVIYTMLLKRRHYYNIVVGGAAGAAGPLIAWAAAENVISPYAWLMFALIFMWTPAHFWALALAIRDEYKMVSVPMLPVVRGVSRTKLEIWLYTLSLLPFSLLLFFYTEASWFYLVASLLLWFWYLMETFKGLKNSDKRSYMKLFYFSILYLFLIFVAIGIDGALRFYMTHSMGS